MKKQIFTKKQKNLFLKLSLFLLLFICISGCAENSDYQNPWDSAPNCRYGHCAPPAPPYGGYGYDRNTYGHDRYGRDPYYDYNRNHNREEWQREHDREEWKKNHDYRPEHYDTIPPPPAPRPEAVIRPSCPPDTTFDGKHCIVPENRRRSGGKGTVNACPPGMWLSGDRCVKN